MKDKLDFTNLADSVARKLTDYLVGLGDLIGGNLKSIVIYGSAVSPDFDPKRSNINLLVVVDSLDLDLLHKVQPYVKKGTRKEIVAPLFLTREHMKTSADVFPIEFLDMSDFHHVVFGDDPFKRLKIGTENLRLECEEKLKGSLINLRQSYLEIADHRGPMMNLVASSITGIVSVFRGLIRLSGNKAPASKKDVIEVASAIYPVESDSFLTALAIKEDPPRMTRDEMDTFFSTYVDDIEKLALHVDKMANQARTPARSPKKSSPKKVAKPADKPAAKSAGKAKKAPAGKKTAKSTTKKKPVSKKSAPKKKPARK